MTTQYIDTLLSVANEAYAASMDAHRYAVPARTAWEFILTVLADTEDPRYEILLEGYMENGFDGDPDTAETALPMPIVFAGFYHLAIEDGAAKLEASDADQAFAALPSEVTPSKLSWNEVPGATEVTDNGR